MAHTRRKFIHASAAAAALSMPRPAHSQTFTARQYHSQPKDSHLQLYLAKIWDAVREETNGRLSVTVCARNNGATVGDPEIFT
jgi:TRAP-type C4-dicarboxylate transport system substrate-binding protein